MLKRENWPDHVSLCNPIERMKKYKSSASDNCETAFAAADPLSYKKQMNFHWIHHKWRADV